MEFLNCDTLEELKECGKLNELSKRLKEYTGTNIKLKANSWNALFESIQALRKVNGVMGNSFFKSESDEVIFYLTQLEGKVRLKKLGVNVAHYSNKKLADKWRRNIAKKIHPDKCKEKLATQAMAELSNIYEEMC